MKGKGVKYNVCNTSYEKQPENQTNKHEGDMGYIYSEIKTGAIWYRNGEVIKYG